METDQIADQAIGLPAGLALLSMGFSPGGASENQCSQSISIEQGQFQSREWLFKNLLKQISAQGLSAAQWPW